MRAANPTCLPRQRGATLIEALIAFLVLSLGMLAMARLQNHLRLNSDVARQRSEAVRLAQEDIETLRSFATIASAPGVRSYAAIAPAEISVQSGTGFHSNASYEVARSVDASDASALKTATVAVHWLDRTGGAQQAVLSSVIARSNPALSAALAVSTSVSTRTAFGRSARIPLAAKDLGNGSSVLKPVAAGTLAFIFDNATGQVTAICSGVGAGTTTMNLSLADLGTCDAVSGMLLSGQVHFSNAAPPDAARANDVPLPLAVRLVPTGGTYPAPPSCASEAQKMVAFSTPAGARRLAVPIDAVPASVGVSNWVDLGERFVAYHCVVTPLNGRWSGRSSLEPQGWALGNAGNEYKVCRYSADQDGSGAVDSNAEHPDSYSHVDATLLQQNFLVIKGDQLCPLGAHVTADVQGTRVYSNLGTVQHQP